MGGDYASGGAVRKLFGDDSGDRKDGQWLSQRSSCHDSVSMVVDAAMMVVG